MTSWEYEDALPTSVVHLATPLLGHRAMMDPELVGALDAVRMQTADFYELWEATRPFDRPVHIVDDYGDDYVDEHCSFKDILREVPGYLAGARSVGLSDSQATGLMVHILKSTEPLHGSSQHNQALWAYGETFRHKGARGEVVDATELQAIAELMTLSGKRDVMDDAAYAHLHATRLGLSTEQTTGLVSSLIARDSLCGYTFEPFNRALQSLVPAPVESETVVSVFAAMLGERPYYNRSLLDGFEDMVVFHGPGRRSPQQLLSEIKRHLDAGMDAADALTEVAKYDFDEQRALSSSGSEVVNPAEEKEKYFFEKDGELEILGLPYRAKRSLQDGLEDLSRIAQANWLSHFEVGEGMWAFDPESETWYSFGGKMELVPGGLRHNLLSYDISALSKEPWVFHVHPLKYVSLIAPPRGQGPNPWVYDRHVESFLLATPSRADYATVEGLRRKALRPYDPRFFIVHELGVTEYSPSDNRQDLADVAEMSRALRDEAQLEFDWHDADSQGLNRRQIVNKLLGHLVSKLPDGFTLAMLDTTDLS